METCFVAHYYACKFGLNRLRINGDIRQKAAMTAILENVVIAIYRLRPIQRIYNCKVFTNIKFTYLLIFYAMSYHVLQSLHRQN